MDHGTLVSELVGKAFPFVLEMGRRFRRDWIVRSISQLPDQVALSRLQVMLEESAFSDISNIYAASSTVERLRESAPVIFLCRLSDFHLLVRIDYAKHGISIGDSAAIAQLGVIWKLHSEIAIADLQGLPRVFWWFLRTPEERQNYEEQ